MGHAHIENGRRSTSKESPWRDPWREEKPRLTNEKMERRTGITGHQPKRTEEEEVNIIQGSLLFPSGTNSLWIIAFLHKTLPTWCWFCKWTVGHGTDFVLHSMLWHFVSDLYSNYVWKKSLQTVTMHLLFIHETMWEGMDIMLIFFPQSSWQTWQTVSWLKCSSSSINLRAIQWSLVKNSLIFATASEFQAVDRHPFLESPSMFSHIPI